MDDSVKPNSPDAIQVHSGLTSVDPWTGSVIVFAVTITWLLSTGSDLWGHTNIFWPLSAEVWSHENSQHPIDPYTLTHLLHGVLCYWLIKLNLPKLPLGRQFFLVIILACAWEIFENSSFVIERYRVVTVSADYVGDAVLNSAMDILACGTGFFLARGIGWSLSVIFFLVIEVAMLFWIRDNLVLNILMLCLPVDSVREWQLGGIS
jgi:hypothetical protein